jgi:hypothetical protein
MAADTICMRRACFSLGMQVPLRNGALSIHLVAI